MFDNTAGTEDLPIELRTIHLQERTFQALPWCRKRGCGGRADRRCMMACTDLQVAKNNWKRVQWAVTQHPGCRRHGSLNGGHKVRMV